VSRTAGRRAVRVAGWLLAAVVAVVLCGCSGGLAAGPSVPSGNDWTTLAPVTPQVYINGVRVDQVPARTSELRSALGIQVYWNSTGTRTKLQNQATRIFNYIVSLGANSTAINFPFYTNGEYPSRVYSDAGETPSPAAVAMVVANAREHGLRVLVRPVLNDDNIKVVSNDWRGSIEPRSVGGWFKSYSSFLRPYLAAAQAGKATSFSIDTELDSLAADKQDWAALQGTAAKLFTGDIVYTENYGLWQRAQTDLPVEDAAVDAYPVLGLTAGATVTQLTSAWVSWLRTHRTESTLQKTVLQEVGIAAVADAYAGPALTPPSGTPLDVPVQQKWFAAACAAAKQTRVAGLYFFDVNSTDNPSDSAATASYAPGSFIDRSDDVIKACFASGWS
jgi:hypothetical protein